VAPVYCSWPTRAKQPSLPASTPASICMHLFGSKDRTHSSSGSMLCEQKTLQLLLGIRGIRRARGLVEGRGFYKQRLVLRTPCS
jgi:hypothetical protein